MIFWLRLCHGRLTEIVKHFKDCSLKCFFLEDVQVYLNHLIKND